MILDRTTFSHHNTVIIEKIKVKAPFKYGALFQDKGCFIYYKDVGPELLSADQKVKIGGQEAVLLKCGNHFLDLLREVEGKEVEAIIVHLYPDLLKKLYLKELPELLSKRGNSSQSERVVASDVISRFIDSLEFYFENPSLVNDDLLELKIKELILLLVQSRNIDSVQELIAGLYSTKAIRLKDVIELHLFSNLSIEELAELCNLSVSSFKREFKKEFNDSPKNYLGLKKIEKAQELLRITKLSISETAYEVGFNDPLYFTRFFKSKTGTSPSDYRIKHKV